MRLPTRVHDLVFLGAAVIVVIAIALAGVWLSPPTTFQPRASSFSARADGGKAAYLLLKQLGYRTERSFEPLSTSPLLRDPAHTTLVLASPLTPPSTQDRRALRAFVDAGGTVLAAGADARFFPELTGARRPAPFEQTPKRALYKAIGDDPVTTGAPTIEIEPELLDIQAPARPFTRQYDQQATPFAPGVLLAHVGAGRIIWWAGATPLLNASIDASGHLELLLNSVGPRDGRLVIWDEYHHGLGRGLWSYIASTPLWAGLLQLAVIAAVGLFTFSRRRGPIHAIVDPPAASSLEFVDALGALYVKARAADGAVDTARTRLRRLLVGASGLSARATDAQVAAAVARRFPIEQQLLDDLLADTAAASGAGPLPPARALSLAQRLQDAAALVRGRKP